MKAGKYQAILLRSLLQRIRLLQALATTEDFAAPSGGWVRAFRQALGMTYREVGERLGVTPQSVVALEKSEAAGVVSVRSLEKAAEALNCRLILAFVPMDGGSVPEDEVVKSVAHSMALENQAVRTDLKNG